MHLHRGPGQGIRGSKHHQRGNHSVPFVLAGILYNGDGTDDIEGNPHQKAACEEQRSSTCLINEEPCQDKADEADEVANYSEEKSLALETLLLVEDNTVLTLKCLTSDLLSKHCDDGYDSSNLCKNQVSGSCIVCKPWQRHSPYSLRQRLRTRCLFQQRYDCDVRPRSQDRSQHQWSLCF